MKRLIITYIGDVKMGKNKAPKYATTTYDTGDLFGSSTTSKKGTTYDPASWMTSLSNSTTTGLNNAVNNLLSNDYSNDANFQAYQDNLNRLAQQNFDASVLSPLANRGLMRSTGLQAATNAFNDSLIDNTTDLMDSYYNRNTNTLNSLLNTQNALYGYLTGTNTGSQTGSQNVSNYNQWKYQQDSANGSMLKNTLGGAINGAMTGSAAGPWGALAGAVIGGAGGALK